MTTRAFTRSLTSTLAAAILLCGAPASAQDPSPSLSAPNLASSALAGADGGPSAVDPVAPQPLRLPSSGSTTVAPNPSVWRDLFGDTVSDVKSLPTKQTLGWLAIGAVAVAGTRPADAHVGLSLSGSTKLVEPLEAGAFIGSTPLQLGMSAATYAIGRTTNSPRMIAVGADLFRAELLAQGLTIGLKVAVRRQRPEGSGYAFPSGHTTVSFASATVLQRHLGWRVGGPAYALASYVALSRVQMRRHYLSDVAFGAALGIAAGRTITLGRERRMQLAPMVTDGGGGVQFTWVGRGSEASKQGR